MKKFWGKVKAFWARLLEKLSEKRVFYAVVSTSAALLVSAIVVLGVIRPFQIVVLGVNVNQRFDQNQLVPFREGGLWGFMDTRGRVAIQPRFDRAKAFNGRYALVGSGDRDQIINRRGEIQIDVLRETVVYDEVTRTWLAGGTLYNHNLRRVSHNRQDVRRGSRGLFPFAEGGDSFGIMNANGRKIFDCGRTSCEIEVSTVVRELRIAYALVTKDNGTSVIINSNNGRVIVEYGETTEVEVRDNNIFRVISVEDGGRTATFYRYIERNRITVEAEDGVSFSLHDPRNRFFLTDFGETWADRGRNGRFAFYRQREDTFHQTSARRPLTISDLTTGITRSSCGNLSGVNDLGDLAILPCEFDDVIMLDAALFTFLRRRVGQELVILKNGQEYTLYDMRRGRTLMTAQSSIQTVAGSTFFAAFDNRNDTVLVYNAITGAKETLSTDGANSWTQGSNFFSINTASRTRFFNNRLEEIRAVSPN
ncbi:WG repeat-containing protein [Candidatus Saccharibacteria bacterium]|nr:WG repeat-containing protein [Candidatus Saccharibacteria bacterium]